jgi:translation initiation factor IF-2
MAKTYRLFKVAKELNVGTSVLVDKLAHEGISIDNSPNAKITPEMYDLLLQEFATDKRLREKAKAMTEKRNEERMSLLNRQDTVTTRKPEEEKKTPEEQIKSATELRADVSRMGGAPAAVEPPVVEEPAPAPVEVEAAPEPVAETPSPAPIEEKPAPEVSPEPEPEPIQQSAEPVQEEPVVEQVPEPAPEPAPEVKPEPVAEAPAVQPKPEEPKPEKEAAPQLNVVGHIDLDALKKKKARPAPAPENKKQEPKQAAPKPEPKPDPKPEEPKEEKIITAGENAPQLAGLKVLGKIDLGDDRKKKRGAKKKDEKPSAKTEDKSGGDAGKRRRKRKRKKVPTTDVSSASKDKRGKRGKKKEISQKELGKSIRSTMAQLEQGSSRSRQRSRRAKRDADAEKRRMQEMRADEAARIIEVTEFITANEFANLIDVEVNDVIMHSFNLGRMITINQRLDAEVIELIAAEYGFGVEFVDAKEQDFVEIEEEDNPEDLKPRDPIITVMGHVDHGKTTLLDHLRKANVAEGEAGGITQHIGAYKAQVDDHHITFLDTPGHEAFTAMRARGAQVTDIVIIVIAADDAVMPQTKEAINHAQAAEVPMVFAFNKIDKPGANADKIRTQLADMDILVEDWGGDYQAQEISAKMGTGVDDLLEKVLIQAELLELQANPDRFASGTVIEARLDRGRGNVATMLVQRGTLKVGDPMVAGIHFGKVRALINQKGERVKEAGPATPVQVLGLTGQPAAGDRFQVYDSESSAKDVAQKRQELVREQTFRQRTRLSLDEFARTRDRGELNLIIKGDVDGSVEALAGSLLKLSTDEVNVNIVMKAVGGITENDVNLASASEAIILAFNTRPSAAARTLADREEIDIRTYSVIYDAINDVKAAMEGLLAPEIKEEVTGTAEIRDLFKISKVGTIAGCMVTSGKINRNDRIRVIRDGVVIYTDDIASLKRFKDDAKEVAAGFECGIMVQNYNDLKLGDVLESFKEIEIKRTLA